MIVQAEVPSCDGWVPEEDVYVPPSVDSFEIAARPNMRKKSQKAEIKEIKRGLLSKTKSLNTISGFFRLASGPRKFFRNPIVHSLISFLSWQERYVILSTDRIDWFLPTHTHTPPPPCPHFHPIVHFIPLLCLSLCSIVEPTVQVPQPASVSGQPGARVHEDVQGNVVAASCTIADIRRRLLRLLSR
jgi:hypothetical protein